MSLFFFVFLYKKKWHFYAQKTRKKNCFVIFFCVEGCVVDHPRITIIKEEEEGISDNWHLIRTPNLHPFGIMNHEYKYVKCFNVTAHVLQNIS